MWTAHDDLWEPDYVERCIEVLDANPDVILACGLSTDIDECGKILPPDIVYREGTIPVDDLAQQGGAHQRFADMIGLEHVCEPIFGVMRLAVLRQTAMHGRFADADRVLLAELALHGRFAVVRKRLFYHREHAHRSMGLYPGRHERSVMMDPENEGKILFPHFKELFEMHLAIQRSPVALGTRLLCYGQLAWWSLRYGRRLFMDLQVASVLIAKRILPMPVQRFLKRILLPQR